MDAVPIAVIMAAIFAASPVSGLLLAPKTASSEVLLAPSTPASSALLAPNTPGVVSAVNISNISASVTAPSTAGAATGAAGTGAGVAGAGAGAGSVIPVSPSSSVIVPPPSSSSTITVSVQLPFETIRLVRLTVKSNSLSISTLPANSEVLVRDMLLKPWW